MKKDYTCGLINTKSINKTTKSCSTYLSAKCLQRGHCVRRTPFPNDRSSALEYSVYRVLTGYRHSMQMGIAECTRSGWRSRVRCSGEWRLDPPRRLNPKLQSSLKVEDRFDRVQKLMLKKRTVVNFVNATSRVSYIRGIKNRMIIHPNIQARKV